MRYRVLAKAIKAARGNRREVMNRLLDAIRDGFAKADIAADGHRAREDIYSIYKKMREKHYTFSQVLDIYGFRVLVPDTHRLLPRAGRAAQPLQADPRQVQGLHRDPEGERLPVAAHHAVRPVRHAARGPDPHPGHAPHRRGRRRRALAVQGGRRARLAEAQQRDAPLAAEPARDPVRVGRLEGVPRAHQGRPLPRRGLRVHAQGQDHGAAARRDRGRLRLRRAHRHRQPLRRREDQLRAGAAAHRAEERRPRRDPHLAHARPNPSWLSFVAHRQGALAHPPFPEDHAAAGVGGARRAAARAGARDAQGRARIDHAGSAGRRCRRSTARRASSRSSPTSAWASGCRSSSRRR